MKNTIDLMTESICKLLRVAFPHKDRLLKTDAQTIKSLVVRSKDTMNSYLTMMNRLTKIDFTLRKDDPWTKSDGYHYDKVDFLLRRMESLYFVCGTCAELEIILPPDDFDSFQTINPLKVSYLLFSLHYNGSSEQTLIVTVYLF